MTGWREKVEEAHDALNEASWARCHAAIAALAAELEAMAEWKNAVVGALNPLREGDDVTTWGHDLGVSSVAAQSIESIRSQRDAARRQVEELRNEAESAHIGNRLLSDIISRTNAAQEGANPVKRQNLACPEYKEFLTLLARGDLAGSERRKVEAHVRVCWRCQHRLDTEREFWRLIMEAKAPAARTVRIPFL